MEHMNVCVVPSHIYNDVIFQVKSFCNR